MITPADYQRILDRAGPEYDACSGLPFAVSLHTVEGIFLRYNGESRRLFNLPAEPTFTASIADFYMHADDRRDNLQRLRRLAPGDWLRDTTIDFKVDGKVKYVRDFTRAIWDPSGETIVALLCLMIPISKGDRYNRLFNDLPVGIFSFRADAGLVNANPRFLEMHGYDHMEEVRHRDASFFLKNPGELPELEKRLFERGHIHNEHQEHVRRDGTTFTASVSARALFGSDGDWIGTEGILEDVTMQAIYLRLVNEVPIGLYSVRINDRGEHELVHCNQRFAANRGAAPAELIGKDLRQYHISEKAFESFYHELVRRDQEGQELVDYVLPAYNGKGELRRYEVHIKLVKDASGRIVGRIGAERDVTDFHDTKQLLEELTTDIGKVLHSYSSTLIHVKQTMDAVIRSFAAPADMDAERGIVQEEKVMIEIRRQAGLVSGFVEKILEKNQEAGDLKEGVVRQLQHLSRLMTSQEGPKAEIQQLGIVRDAGIRLRSLLEEEVRGNFPRELLKEGQRQLRDILRLCSLVTLARGVDTVLEMEQVVNNLRSYILTPVKHKEPIQRVDLYDLLVGVTRKMEEFAHFRKVDLRLNLKQIKDVYIDGYEDDLARALLNLLHNAIKYSWTRKGPARAFVTIEGRQDDDWIYLSIENWGVAITQEELDKGLLFKVGYRGVNSSDRRRPGTGLGLYDSRKVVEKHHGRLHITSEPSLGNARDDYSNPFVTTVTIQLPRNTAIA